MSPLSGRLLRCMLSLSACLLFLALTGCAKKSPAETAPTDLVANVAVPFHFVAYGDARFHDSHDTEAANPAVRQALVQAVADAHPAFICFTGDIVYNGGDKDDWKVFDKETGIWREKKIPVFPAIGNHELHGNEKEALANYFHRFPDLHDNRYYSVRAANALILVLDSSLDETLGPQGQWLQGKLDNIPAAVDFVFIMLHHPPYTSSTPGMFGEGHVARSHEKDLARLIETRQARTRARFVVFSGHVHNYERHEHGGVTYFVTGGAGAHAYPIQRAPSDPFKSHEINYHYLLVDIDRQQLTVTMNRLQLVNGEEVWTQPDSVKIAVPAPAAAAGAAK
ncbi:MAG: metallophosphoesterase family protein [Terriglobales bacterium]